MTISIVKLVAAMFLVTQVAITMTTAFMASSTTRTFGGIRSSSSSSKINFSPLPDFGSEEEYLSYMESISELPKGFASGTGKGTFISQEAPAMGDLPIQGTVIYLPEGPTENWAAVFTKNKFPGSPIHVGRARLASGAPLQALVINNKVSNVCSGGDGIATAELVCQAVADGLELELGKDSVLPSSTGVIGWRLPGKELAEQVVPKAINSLQSQSALDAARAIMTTDRFPKVRSCTLKSNGARLVGIAKGAGMIEPNMATMLSYLMTDATIPKQTLQSILNRVVPKSFNAISVDGDESTSDTVVLLASNQIPNDDDTTDNMAELEQEFETALLDLCQGLASDLVRNGEGTGHVMRVKITNFPNGDDDGARLLGRHIVNSPLFKCAVSGNDPNTGRLAGAIGSFMGKYKDGIYDSVRETTTLTLGDRIIFQNGKFVLEGDDIEKELSDHMKEAQYDEVSNFPPHQKYVEIGVDFGDSSDNDGSATVLGSDLTKEYVVINADYRS